MHRFLDRFGNCFSSYAPDFNFCFRYLMLFDSFLFMDRALVIHYALSRSNGATQQSSGSPNTDNEHLRRNASGELILEGTLLPELTTVGNTIIYEYAQVQTEAGSRFPAVDRGKYLAYLNSEVIEIQDPQRRTEWQRMIENIADTTPPLQESGASKPSRASVSGLLRKVARTMAGSALKANPELVLQVTPSRVRQKLAANRWEFDDSARAMFCALNFDCPPEPGFPRPNVASLVSTILPESET
jgi:hypothetical protein